MSKELPDVAAFIGLGVMGLPISTTLAGGLGRLAVADLDPEHVAAAVAASDNISADAATVADADLVFLCLPSSDAAGSIVNDLLSRDRPGRIIVDLGAHKPEFVTATARLAADCGSIYCDAPVFGIPSMAARGELYFLFSGPDEVWRMFAPLAGKVGYRSRHAGGTGVASTIKLLQNALGTANLLASAEAISICESAGVDTALFIKVVRECGGIGLSTVFERFADDMAGRHDSGEGRLRIAARNARQAADLAAAYRVRAAILEGVALACERAMARGMGDRQLTSIIEQTTPGSTDSTSE